MLTYLLEMLFRAYLRGCFHRLGDNLGGSICCFNPFRPFRSSCAGSVLPGHYFNKHHGFHRYHQVFQR